MVYAESTILSNLQGRGLGQSGPLSFWGLDISAICAYAKDMPNLNVYIPKELAEALKEYPAINRSKVTAQALRQAIKRAKTKKLGTEEFVPPAGWGEL